MVLFVANCKRVLLLVDKSVIAPTGIGIGPGEAVALHGYKLRKRHRGRITYLCLLAERLTITYT